MRVKLLSRMAGPTGNWEAGSVISVPEAQGKALVDGRFAVALQDPPVAPPPAPPAREPESASLEPKESAMLPRGRGRRRGSNEE